jgi:hypothetical protein
MKTKQEMSQLSEEEWLNYHNTLVEENENTNDEQVIEKNEKQMEVLREVWIARNGLKKEPVIKIRRPRF